MFRGAASGFEGGGEGSTPVRLSFPRENHEDVWVGNLEVLAEGAVTDSLLDNPGGALSLSSSLSDFFVDREP